MAPLAQMMMARRWEAHGARSQLRRTPKLYRDLHAAQPHSYPAFGSSAKAAFFHREDETVALG